MAVRKRFLGFALIVLAGVVAFAAVAVGAWAGAFSGDGRFVVFSSGASDLVPGDTNEALDAFVRDRVAGTTERVSVSSGGAQANNASGSSAISADGRFVAFLSAASNLVPGTCESSLSPLAPCEQVFVRDRLLGTTELVSVNGSGEHADHESSGGSMSADGRFVVFSSIASNLVPGDTNEAWDVFVRDRLLGTTERVSVSSDGAQANTRYPLGESVSGSESISADGRFVSFVSDASNLVAGDTNGTQDVFVRDRQQGTTERVSVGSDGAQANSYSDFPAISADGRFVAFRSWASNLVAGDTNQVGDVFVRDRLTGLTERVSVSSSGEQENFYSVSASISADGRFVAFDSWASNLVADDTNDCQETAAHFSCPDVFVHDRLQGTTERVSVRSNGEQAKGESGVEAISGDGRFVVFDSDAPNLVPGDTNKSWDVFIHDRLAATTTLLNVRAPIAPTGTHPPSIPSSGHTGDTITCAPGTWTGSPNLTFTWLRDNHAIRGHTDVLDPTYKLSWDDGLWHRIRCRVTAHNAYGATSADTNELITTPLRPKAGRLVLRPSPTRAGKQLTATMPVTAGGTPVTAGRLACTAALAGRKLAASAHRFRAGSARCVWKIPKSARGKQLRGALTITTANGTASRRFAGTVR